MELSIIELGERLQRARKETGMSQAAAAEMLGISKATIYRWEHSQRRISDTLLERVCEIYNRPAGWFLSLEDRNPELESGESESEPTTHNRVYPVVTERIFGEIVDASAYRPIIKKIVNRYLCGLKRMG